MSVLMTAGRRANQQKKKLSKGQTTKIARPPVPATPSGPPPSNEMTSVWYLLLDSQTTTIMFHKQKNEVWCNGFLLERFDGFMEGDDEDDDDYEEGDILDFTIFIAQSQKSHRGRLIRLPTAQVCGFSTHRLLVDGCVIPENLPYPEDDDDEFEGDDEPPTYEDALGSSADSFASLKKK